MRRLIDECNDTIKCVDSRLAGQTEESLSLNPSPSDTLRISSSSAPAIAKESFDLGMLAKRNLIKRSRQEEIDTDSLITSRDKTRQQKSQ